MIELDRVELIERARPTVRVFCAAPKGERVDWMVDQMSQAGAASWTPILTARTVVEPRSEKLDRLGRIAFESMKQSGRAWVMDIGGMMEISDAVAYCEAQGLAVIVAEAGGGKDAPRHEAYGVFIGPEGGWTGEELGFLREAATRTNGAVVTLSPHVMRIETAAVAAVSWCFR